MIEIPGFEIKREIGASAMATVYLALQSSLDREVALKAMAPSVGDDPALSQRFMQEARMLASLAHPNIVAVYDVDVVDGNRPYFSMQYLPGGDMSARVAAGMSESELIETLDGVGQALEYVHRRGLIHRDVAPGNILYDMSDTPILTDFGIARALGSNAASTGTDFAAVTGHYMSPEQARGAVLDARADLYSLGALTYFGLTGKPPYDGADGFAVAYAHVFEPIPKLPGLHAHWQSLIDRALAKDPSQRFADAREFLDALAQIAQHPRTTLVNRSDDAAAIAISEKVTVPSSPLPDLSAGRDVTGAPNAMPAAVPVEVGPEENYATVQRPVPKIEAAAPLRTPVQSDAPTPIPARPAKPIKPVPPIKPAVPPAPPPAAPTVVAQPLPSLPPEVIAGAPAKRRGATRWWPLLLVAAGCIAIAVALYAQFGRRAASGVTTLPTSKTQPLPLTTSPQDQTTLSQPVNTTPPPTQTPADATAANIGSNANTANEAAAHPSSTDATAMPSLDAAAEAALGEFEPVIDLAKLPTVVDPVSEALRLGRVDLANGRLTTPSERNALDRFQFVLKRDPKNKAAKSGIVDIAKKYIELADKGQGSGDLAAYLESLTSADDVAKNVAEGADVRKDVAMRRAKAAEPYLAQARAAASEWDKTTAKAAYEKALQIDSNSNAAREGIKFVATIGEIGFAFHDKLSAGGNGPELIILASKIAAGRRDVTRADFRRYWNAAGRAAFAGKEPACRDRESFFRSAKDRTWQAPGFEQDDSHPVVCIDWPEAAGYAQWLSRETGKKYRLLSAAEFDQTVARGNADCSNSNLADAAYNKKFDSRDGAPCDDGYAATSPAGHFEASGGLFDTNGNVRVWVNACGNGGAVPASGCRDYLVKGRAWMSPAKQAPTASDTFGSDVALNTVGFRVVREIDK